MHLHIAANCTKFPKNAWMYPERAVRDETASHGTYDSSQRFDVLICPYGAYHRLLRNEEFIHQKDDQAYHSNDEWNQDCSRGPRILDSAPG